MWCQSIFRRRIEFITKRGSRAWSRLRYRASIATSPRAILTYHVVAGRMTSKELREKIKEGGGMGHGERFGVIPHSESVQWAAAEGVSETVIALLLNKTSVNEIVAKLSASRSSR